MAVGFNLFFLVEKLLLKNNMIFEFIKWCFAKKQVDKPLYFYF